MQTQNSPLFFNLSDGAAEQTIDDCKDCPKDNQTKYGQDNSLLRHTLPSFLDVYPLPFLYNRNPQKMIFRESRLELLSRTCFL